jgi:CheY-like chemotaxis protein
MRVLIADDNREVRSALRLALSEVAGQGSEPTGLAVHEAGNTAELLLVLLDHRDLRLLLLDWELPGFDAKRALPVIKTRNPGCVVVAMSGRTEAERQSLDCGADHFVSKNDPPNRVFGLLSELLTSPA